MPTWMPSDTRDALGQNAENCDSRSLLLDKLVYDHPEMGEARKLHFSQVCRASFPTIQSIRREWERVANDLKARPQDKAKAQAFLQDSAGIARRGSIAGLSEGGRAKATTFQAFVRALNHGGLLYAQLQSRLMVNMAGGVMENAGLCLDRFGLPYIPGSAVKGCARRAALAALREWCETNTKPSGDDNPLAPICQPFDSPAEMLAAIARVVGWVEQDWSLPKKDNRSVSDFAWACGNDPEEIWKPAAEKLCRDFGWTIPEEKQEYPWKALLNHAGSISFLPAYPVDLGKTGKVDRLPLPVPELGQLELDVVTCHHRDYYAGKLSIATDTEEPNPVVFPTVAPGHVFCFALVSLRGADRSLLDYARTWLATGLHTFGLGAKTNAGYGWFDCSAFVQNEVKGIVQQQVDSAKKAAAEAEAKRQEEALKAAKAREEEERLATLPPHEQFKVQYLKLDDEPFAAQAKKFADMNDDQRHGFVLALKERRETSKRWSKKKPELIKPWQEFAQTLTPPVQLP